MFLISFAACRSLTGYLVGHTRRELMPSSDWLPESLAGKSTIDVYCMTCVINP